jgi:hypothetical protein
MAAQNKGMEIEWNPSDPDLMNIRDQIIAENPRGKLPV